MKKMPLSMMIIGLVFFAAYAFAQSPAEMGMTSVTKLGTFLQDINSNIGQRNVTIKEDEYPSFEEKYSNGLMNIASSWIEIPDNVIETAAEQNIIVASTIGLGKGILSGIGRLAAGTYDLTTIPISPDKKPLLEAKYKVKNPEEGLKFDILEW